MQSEEFEALLDAEGIFTFDAFGETIRMYLPDVAQDVIQGLIATTGSFFEMNHLTGVYRDKLIPRVARCWILAAISEIAAYFLQK